MTKKIKQNIRKIAASLLLFGCIAQGEAESFDPVEYVNPLMGSQSVHELWAGHACGHICGMSIVSV